MTNWVFVINDKDGVFQERINEKKWPIYRKTQNRNKLKVGDKIIFYKAGMGGKKFIGKATISRGLKPHGVDFSLDLSDVDIWKKPVSVASVLNNLEFIKDKTFWGRYFQGGVRSLSDSDYSAILSEV
jgi:hypothetical protein